MLTTGRTKSLEFCGFSLATDRSESASASAHMVPGLDWIVESNLSESFEYGL